MLDWQWRNVLEYHPQLRVQQRQFGAYYQRKRAQNGTQFAQVATAHKIARTVYHLLKYHVQYQDIGADGLERKQRERDVLSLQKKAAKLGFTLIPPASVETAV